MRGYEITFIFKPEVESFSEGKEFVKKQFETAGIKILKEDDMGERNLAYPIKKNEKAHYVLFKCQSNPDSIQTLEKSIKIRPEILKFLIVRQ